MIALRQLLGRYLCTLALSMATAATFAAPAEVPTCRLDDAEKALVQSTLARAAAAFREIGKPLPFDDVKVNERAGAGKSTLVAYIVTDANDGTVSQQGCSNGTFKSDQPLDPISVRGGCILVAGDRLEIRCSVNAIRIFGDVGQKTDGANPALLYALSHELGHLYQRRVGEYTGRAERIDLTRDQASKLQDLQTSCDPASTRKEDEADTIAVEVLTRTLAQAPYRESLFSDRGSLYWNIDQLALASDTWMKATLKREFMSQPEVHKTFVPTEFPTPAKKVDANARKFVCDVLTRTKGSIYHPLKSLTHPPVEQRLRRIAEALQPIAKTLPDNAAQRPFTTVARLQTDLGPIFTQIYRETGVYMEAVQDSICTKVNAPTPPKCK
ncbi:MAG: hypothetical protein IPQ01_10775 [Zoogloea sp.]|nr:hypothetical protein [Zoogloea sp.]